MQETLAQTLEALGFEKGQEQVAALTTYIGLLSKWNQSFNLTGANTSEAILKEIVDSLHVAQFVASLPLEDTCQSYDLGAGAGLPGIPLRILWHKGTYTLIERKTKRALFLAQVLAKLKLPKTLCFRGSVEEFQEQHADSGALILSKAYKPWDKLLPSLPKLLAPKGLVVMLTCEKPPANFPHGFRLLKSQAYTLQTKTRWLWALTL
ncbi:MAG: class I SAM-dependent methyltransferase [Desulfovibrionaceae bacterium]|nr:class I SAM-dependent methyltransferase [Desulfovibrionaceae bacterium]